MGAHLIDDEFQSDKYPTCPRGKVPLSVRDRSAQDLLWEYAQRRRRVDAEFSADLETALLVAGYQPRVGDAIIEHAALLRRLEEWAQQLEAGAEAKNFHSVGKSIAAELRARINSDR